MNQTHWNDDERDTHDYIQTPKVINNNSKGVNTDIKYESIVKVIQDYHKDVYNSVYTATDTNYKKENKLTKPKSTYMYTYVNSVANQNNKKEIDILESEEDQEFNNDILDKQIYRKCWYS